jgi:hypothetical protein
MDLCIETDWSRSILLVCILISTCLVGVCKEGLRHSQGLDLFLGKTIINYVKGVVHSDLN